MTNSRVYEEPLKKCREVCEILGIGRTYLTAIRKAMNIKSRYQFVSEIRAFIRKNPDFSLNYWRGSSQKTSDIIPAVSGPLVRVAAVKRSQSSSESQSASANSGRIVQSGAGEVVSKVATDVDLPAVAQPPSSKNVCKPRRVNRPGLELTGELGYKLRQLRGEMSVDSVARQAGLSRESVRRIEHRGTVKLMNLQKIAKCLNASDEQWLGLLVSWLRRKAGKDAERLTIEARADGVQSNRDPVAGQCTDAMKLFERLDPMEREQVILTMKRRQVIGCLSELHKVIDASV